MSKKLELDFNKLEDAVLFVENLWVGNQPVLGVQLGTGWLSFSAMTPDQIKDYAQELFTNWFNKKGSKLTWIPPVTH